MKKYKNEKIIIDIYSQLVENNCLSDLLGDVGEDKTPKKILMVRN